MPDSVWVVDEDGWEILLRIDGLYAWRNQARAIAELFQQAVHGLAEQMRRHPDAKKGYEPEKLCPVCGKESILCHRLDRYLHTDGSDNRKWWDAILRGEGTSKANGCQP